MALIQALRIELEIIRSNPAKFKVEYGLGNLLMILSCNMVDEHDLVVLRQLQK
jgi:hypothetical protein